MEQHLLNALNELNQAYKSIMWGDQKKKELMACMEGVSKFFRESFPHKSLEYDELTDKFYCRNK